MSRVYHYYNEFDPVAAAWLRKLIKQKLIPDGFVDERSITDVDARDLEGFRQCHFFAGIAGWPLALRLAGVSHETPLWTGSPPCQPFSAAGKQLGQFDPRHLAPVFLRLVSECRPAKLYGEQVAPAIAKSWMCDLQTHLEREGYAVGFTVLPACSVGAPHKRERLFFGAHQLADAAGARHLRSESTTSETGWKPEHESAGKLPARPGGRAISSIQQSPGVGSMGYADNTRLEGWEGMPECSDKQSTRAGSVESGLADPAVHGHFDATRPPHVRQVEQQQGRAYRKEERQQSATERGSEFRGMVRASADPHHDFWSDADWLGCRDGKFRPVEPGTFPLANGIPARVGRLRGYGNAIVPQVAAEFIIAFNGAIEDLSNDGRF